jgi:hypothetical protein
MSFRVRLVESDEEIRKAFGNLAKAGEATGKINLGGVLSSLTSGFGVLGALSGLLGQKFRDDEEGHFLGCYREMKDGHLLKITLRNEGKEPIAASVFKSTSNTWQPVRHEFVAYFD